MTPGSRYHSHSGVKTVHIRVQKACKRESSALFPPVWSKISHVFQQKRRYLLQKTSSIQLSKPTNAKLRFLETVFSFNYIRYLCSDNKFRQTTNHLFQYNLPTKNRFYMKKKHIFYTITMFLFSFVLSCISHERTKEESGFLLCSFMRNAWKNKGK